jgi:hypothetical protein
MFLARNSSVLFVRVVLLTVAGAFISIALFHSLSVPSAARSQGERTLDIQIPGHLPIKVKFKKEHEKAFKDRANEQWLRDFEIEVTNTGNKPIYFLHLVLTAHGVTAPDGNEMGWVLQFGRKGLGDIWTKAGPDDVPIRPGDMQIFSLGNDSEVENWARFRRERNKPDALRLVLEMTLMSFGDGTGFAGTDGVALPRPQQQRSALRNGTTMESVQFPKRAEDANPPGSLRSAPAKLKLTQRQIDAS